MRTSRIQPSLDIGWTNPSGSGSAVVAQATGAAELAERSGGAPETLSRAAKPVPNPHSGSQDTAKIALNTEVKRAAEYRRDAVAALLAAKMVPAPDTGPTAQAESGQAAQLVAIGWPVIQADQNIFVLGQTVSTRPRPALPPTGSPDSAGTSKCSLALYWRLLRCWRQPKLPIGTWPWRLSRSLPKSMRPPP